MKFGRHIANGNLSKVEYAIKMINNAKALIPPPSENGIVSKLSRHFHDDVRTAIILINVRTFENLIELLDTFDQAGSSNASSSNNTRSYNLGQNYRFCPNAYGELSLLYQNSFSGRNYVLNAN